MLFLIEKKKRRFHTSSGGAIPLSQPLTEHTLTPSFSNSPRARPPVETGRLATEWKHLLRKI